MTTSPASIAANTFLCFLPIFASKKCLTIALKDKITDGRSHFFHLVRASVARDLKDGLVAAECFIRSTRAALAPVASDRSPRQSPSMH